MRQNSFLAGEVTSLTFGGEGIVRSNGLVIFVPFTAVGDNIRYQVVQKKKNYCTGKLVEIIEPSPQRTISKCPYFGTCGGCQLQHLNSQAQLDYKRTSVEDALKRIGGFTDLKIPSAIPAEQPWSYRRRVTLTLKPMESRYRLGYIGADQHSLIEVELCPIFIEPNETIIKIAQEIVRDLIPSSSEEAKLAILKLDNGKFLFHFHFKTAPDNLENVLESAKKFTEIASIHATTPTRAFQVGKYEPSLSIGNLNFSFSPKAFIQNHPEQSLKIYQAIHNHAKATLPASALDLYCGIGISSLLLASVGIAVTGIELNPEAIRFAKKNAQQNELSNAKFLQGDVENHLEKALQKHPELIIVNPPREGLSKKVAELLSRSYAKTLIYISCMPSTLARDLKILCASAYSLETVQPYDMFPQTAHVEALTLMKKN